MNFKKVVAMIAAAVQLFSAAAIAEDGNANEAVAVDETSRQEVIEQEQEVPADELRVYVSENGSDSNDGSFQKPLKNITTGISKGAQLKNNNPDKTVSVNIRGGDYYITSGIKLNTSGTPGHPFVIQAYNNEKVNIKGSKRLNPRNFQPLKDKAVLAKIPSKARKHIGVYKLSEIRSDVGEFTGQNSSIGTTAFIVNGSAQTLAKYPNNEKDTISKVHGNTSFSGNLSESRMARWKTAETAYISGYFGVEYSFSDIKLASIDDKINITERPYYGLGANNRFFIQNLIEELDNPGEYYVDRINKLLYYYPQYSLGNADMEISTMIDDMIYANGLSYVTIKGLGLKNSRKNGINVIKSNNIIIDGCIIENLGMSGIVMSECSNSKIINCDIAKLESKGIQVSGGDRQTLTRADILIENNHIYDFARRVRVYNPGIELNGVGITVLHNLIHDSTSQGIMLTGNEMTIKYNELYHLATEMNDAGAIYMGRNYTMRGNEIAYNYIHDIDTEASKLGSVFVTGVYLDDLFSSANVHHNVFYKCHLAAMIGGGRDNNFDNNILVDCDNGMFFDARGVGWGAGHAAKGGQAYNTILQVPYNKPPYSEKYPELVSILDDPSKLGLPMNNSVCGNVMSKCMSNMVAGEFKTYGKYENNYETKTDDENDLFTDYENLDFSLKAGSAVAMSNPEAATIDMSQMGLTSERGDEERKIVSDRSFRLSYPKNGDKDISNLGCDFKWEKHSGSDLYRIDIATDPEMKNIIISQESNLNTANVKYIPSGKQALWWTVTGINTSRSMSGEFKQFGAPRLMISTATEKTDKNELIENLDTCQQLFSGVTEGTKGGTFKIGYKDLLKQAIDNAQEAVDSTDITQKEIEAISQKVKEATDAFVEYLNYDTVNLGDKIKNEETWKYDDGYYTFEDDGTLRLSNENGRANHYAVCMYDEDLGPYTAVKFGYKVDNLGSNYCIIGLQNNGVFLNGGYDIIIKSNQLEIQRVFGNPKTPILTQDLNYFISEGKWTELEFGAIRMKTGTYIFLKADGYLVTDYLDTEAPLWTGDSKFVFTNPSGTNTECVASVRAAKE